MNNRLARCKRLKSHTPSFAIRWRVIAKKIPSSCKRKLGSVSGDRREKLFGRRSSAPSRTSTMLSENVEPAPCYPNNRSAQDIEAHFEAKRKELGVADELKGIPGLTTLMLVAFGEHGIKTIEDLAGCATDDLCGWVEYKSGSLTQHEGILRRFDVSRAECDALILHARAKVGWI
jgi:hypothetical protein